MDLIELSFDLIRVSVINNATDKDYGVRGFYGWDADPRAGDGFEEESFQQLGAPKVIGLSVRADF